MPLNEARIYENRPVWAGCEEISRDSTSVWFKGRMGRTHRASLSDVEAYERKQKMRGKV